jgi:trans-aconitate 2-methyltransferase
MAAWDPKQYSKFERERTQPARDLLARIDLDSPARITDLGCGPGNSTALLVERWPGAAVEGVDSDEAMLLEARRRSPRGTWYVADAATWEAEHPQDLVFSNAVLHWVPRHAELVPRLLAQVRPGGVLAVQMPRNFADPSHTAIAETEADGPWAQRFLRKSREAPVHEPDFYFDLLAAHASHVELWETRYFHVFDDAAAVVEWVKGTALRPTLAALDAGERPLFLEGYRSRVARHYPPSAGGKVLFPFRRLFFVASR